MVLSNIFLIFTKQTKNKTMGSKKQDLFEQMTKLFTQFTEEHNKTTKVSQKNARTAIGDLKKLVTDYRAASVEETKSAK